MMPARNDIPFPIRTLLARGLNARRTTRLGAEQVSFQYSYRDAANYSLRGTAIFPNARLLALEEIEGQIRSCLKDGEFFIARQVYLEERFFDVLHADSDHPWHRFDQVDHTTEPSFDPARRAALQRDRDITEFIADLVRAQRAGWDEMNVRPDLAALLQRSKWDGLQ
jgi:hypothetical protein